MRSSQHYGSQLALVRQPFSWSLATTLLLLLSCSLDKTEVVIGLNENIHHDDFEYAVTDFRITKKIGQGRDALTAQGNYFIVSFRVISNAVRVDHHWDNTIAYIKDKEGNTYENQLPAQQALNQISPFGWQQQYTTPLKSVQTTQFVFDLPANVKEPYLMVRGETLMQDFFDGGQFRRKKIKLF